MAERITPDYMTELLGKKVYWIEQIHKDYFRMHYDQERYLSKCEDMHITTIEKLENKNDVPKSIGILSIIIMYFYLVTWYMNEIMPPLGVDLPWQQDFFVMLGFFLICITPIATYTLLKRKFK